MKVKEPKFIKVNPKVGTKDYDLIGVVDYSVLNIQSLSFVTNCWRFCLTCPRNLTLGRTIVM
jgi:hypothetical protein